MTRRISHQSVSLVNHNYSAPVCVQGDFASSSTIAPRQKVYSNGTDVRAMGGFCVVVRVVCLKYKPVLAERCSCHDYVHRSVKNVVLRPWVFGRFPITRMTPEDQLWASMIQKELTTLTRSLSCTSARQGWGKVETALFLIAVPLQLPVQQGRLRVRA